MLHCSLVNGFKAQKTRKRFKSETPKSPQSHEPIIKPKGSIQATFFFVLNSYSVLNSRKK